jgi:DNA-binding CsgD family transcriptional regulator
MIKRIKSTEFSGLLPNDSSIEFFGERKTKQVYWLRNGNAHYFADLPFEYYSMLKAAYSKDHQAQGFLREVTDDERRQVELYTYYLYGSLDSNPDIKNGSLSLAENFRSSKNCPSLRWNSKQIRFNGKPLSPRQIVIIDFIADDLPDKAIAQRMNISQSTLDFHKRNLFELAGVQTKVGLIKKAVQENIVII